MLNVVEEYEINPFTLWIEPVWIEGFMYSRIVEVEEEIMVKAKPIDIIKKSCEYFGSDYNGRRKGTRYLTGYTHKAPIEIEKSFSLYMFPTTSPDRDNCIWIALSNIKQYMKDGPFCTRVVYRNKKQICLSMSFSAFETQFARTAILKNKLEQNVMETKRRYALADQET
ncbi:competence protein ComK [Bacillus testis]|uniref:competence protein ComK n=1 Tax=Bacillus testis TaxID=1622072 RepID=UPI000A4FACEA|nr:competence protein ComK [Bacillus testis]